MARMARVVVPNFPHHVIQRGNRRQRTFFLKDDFQYYKNLLAKYCGITETEVWAYCLMPNHVHLIMLPKYEDGLRAALGETHRYYTNRINSRYGWRGHLWQERFHSFVMDEDHLLAAVRYVERNPILAGLCTKPEEWRWSSARAHLNGIDDKLVRLAPMMERIDNWKNYLADAGKGIKKDDVELHARTGRPMGSDAFVKKLELITGKELSPRKRGRKAGYKKQKEILSVK